MDELTNAYLNLSAIRNKEITILSASDGADKTNALREISRIRKEILDKIVELENKSK